MEVSLKTGIRVREFEGSKRKQIIADRDKYKRAKKGDIAYNMMRMWQGAVGIAPVDGLVSPAYVVAKPLKDVDVRYFNYLFHTQVYMGEVDNCSRGIVKDRNRLYWENFKQIYSPCPPFKEQSDIAEAIESMTKKIRDAITGAEREMALLREYRTRLISDVVTGKLDVREAAAQLPDDAGETEPFDEIETGLEAEEVEDPDAVPEETEA